MIMIRYKWLLWFWVKKTTSWPTPSTTGLNDEDQLMDENSKYFPAAQEEQNNRKDDETLSGLDFRDYVIALRNLCKMQNEKFQVATHWGDAQLCIVIKSKPRETHSACGNSLIIHLWFIPLASEFIPLAYTFSGWC